MSAPCDLSTVNIRTGPALLFFQSTLLGLGLLVYCVF